MMKQALILVLLLIGSVHGQTPTTTTGYTAPTTTAGATQPPTRPPMTTAQPVDTTTAPAGSAERECACTVSNIWLDIVAVIDNSLTMTQEGISQIQATLSTVIHQLKLSPSGGYASRIGVVTFNDNALVVANLTRFSDTDDFMDTLFGITISNQNSGVNILSGLQNALNLLRAVPSTPNRRSVIILFTSAYNNEDFNDPLPMARSLISDNIKLVTVAFSERMESDAVLQVGELAYPNFNLTNSQADLINTIYDRFCQANCFCSGNWMQYRQSFADAYSRSYGLCLYHADIPAAWTPAKMACHSEANNSYLVTEFSQTKHDFNVAYARNMSNNGNADFHIGLAANNGQYFWEQPNKRPTVPLQGYKSWNPHYPNPAAGACVQNANIIGNTMGWTNVDCWSKAKLYICQVNTCDTDNYCP